MTAPPLSTFEAADVQHWEPAACPVGRSRVARQRSMTARAALANCHLCAHHCGVNRLAGERGPCRAGVETHVFSAQVEVADELELIPTFAVALSGCDLRCSFCITGAESWNPRAGQLLDAARLAEQAARALDEGARTIMILGGEPTVHLPAALEIVAALSDEAKLVWKTNAHGSAQARELLDGLFDVWLADYKFGNDPCALRLAGVSEYSRVVRENLRWMFGQSAAADVRRLASPSSIKQGGDDYRASSHQADRKSELIVRHLLMPGHIDCCWAPVAEWLAAHVPGVKVNLRSGFWPGWQAARYPELRRTVSMNEIERAWKIAGDCHLNLIE